MIPRSSKNLYVYNFVRYTHTVITQHLTITLSFAAVEL